MAEEGMERTKETQREREREREKRRGVACGYDAHAGAGIDGVLRVGL